MKITIQATTENEALELYNIQKTAFFPLYEKYHDEDNPCLRGVEDVADRLNSVFFAILQFLWTEKLWVEFFTNVKEEHRL